MSALAVLGGSPVTSNLLQKTSLKNHNDLARTYLLDAFDSGVWDDWPGVESMASAFQQEWADFNDSRFCALLTNGTHTLQVALETLDIGAFDEVIVPGLTWQATASAVCDVNAVPVIVDVDPETLCIDPKAVEAAITPKTRAIIPVHLYHRMADMDALLAIAKKHNLHIIEDTAHVHGSQWRGKSAGTIGTFGSFSFQRSKLMNAGEGGALLMQDEDLYWKVVSQRSCGREFKPGVKVHSGNYRMTSFQAAILRAQLVALRENAEVMDRTSRAFDRAIEAAPGVRPLFRSENLTRQCSYGFVFLYDQNAFDGLPATQFRKALSAELGVTFGTTYEPLNQSPVYYPHTKKRHQLSQEYMQAITPSRWQLPVAEALWRDRVVQALWSILGCPIEKAHLLTDAIGKIYEQRHALLENPK